jgi:glycosyltransferase involved in cell wall biosynthesis
MRQGKWEDQFPFKMKSRNSSKRHIVFVNTAQVFGGREKRLIDWLRFVDYTRVHATIVAPKDVYSDSFKKYHIPVNVKETRLDLHFSFINLYKWFRFLKDLNPDEILLMQGYYKDFALFFLLIGFILTGGKVSMSEHATAPPPPAKSSKLRFRLIPDLGLGWYRYILMMRSRYSLARQVIAVSNSVKQGLLKWGCPEEKISVINHGIDVTLFRPSKEGKINFRQISRIPQDAIVIVSTSRLEKGKGYDRLVHVFNILGEKYPNLWLILAGDGSLKEQLIEEVKHKGRVAFLGQLTQEDVAGVLQASDIYALPTDNEGSPMGLFEAMATGLICVATNVPGPIDMIRHGVNGFLVDPSEEAILAMIESLMFLDPIRKRQVGESAVQSAAKYKMGTEIGNVLSILNIPSTCPEDCVSASPS